MAATFNRLSQTMNTMMFKPIVRKSFHKRSSSTDTMRETKKLEMDETLKSKNYAEGNDNNTLIWVPHEKTGIYYPKGQEKVMEGVPQYAGKDVGVNWFSIKH